MLCRSNLFLEKNKADCFGYVLHSKLEAMYIQNLVVRPCNWDEYGNRVKTDKRDAKEHCNHLDRYFAGSEKEDEEERGS